MALDTYSGLVASIIAYAFRSGDTDFAATVPSFIQLAEARINRALRVGDMEKAATIPLTDGAGTLPADYIEARRVTAGRATLDLVTPDYAADHFPSNLGGIGLYYTIIGPTIQTYPAGTGDLSLSYYARIPALTEAAPANWLLAKAPDLYLYGALIEAAPFMLDDARLQTWMTLFRAGLKDLQDADKSARFSRATARVSGPTP